MRVWKICKKAILVLLILMLVFVMAFPFFYMLTSSVKKDTDVFSKSMFYIPTQPNWQN